MSRLCRRGGRLRSYMMSVTRSTLTVISPMYCVSSSSGAASMFCSSKASSSVQCGRGFSGWVMNDTYNTRRYQPTTFCEQKIYGRFLSAVRLSWKENSASSYSLNIRFAIHFPSRYRLATQANVRDRFAKRTANACQSGLDSLISTLGLLLTLFCSDAIQQLILSAY